MAAAHKDERRHNSLSLLLAVVLLVCQEFVKIKCHHFFEEQDTLLRINKETTEKTSNEDSFVYGTLIRILLIDRLKTS